MLSVFAHVALTLVICLQICNGNLELQFEYRDALLTQSTFTFFLIARQRLPDAIRVSSRFRFSLLPCAVVPRPAEHTSWQSCCRRSSPSWLWWPCAIFGCPGSFHLPVSDFALESRCHLQGQQPCLEQPPHSLTRLMTQPRRSLKSPTPS